MPFPAIFELSSLAAGGGTAGFVIEGVTSLDYSGRSVSTAGDVNGDGVDDVIIGARFADPGGSKSGAAYVVFGRTDAFTATFELSSLATGGGSLGFVMDGVSANDYAGFSVSEAGDVNGDGIGDVIVGAYGADPHGSKSGVSYVVFGSSSGFPPVFKLSTLSGGDGGDGFVLVGAASGDESGISVSRAGDVNGDRIDDIIIGARNADPNSSYSGVSYVVFGTSDGFQPVIELSGLSLGGGATGFVVEGAAAFDYSGRSVSAAGDVNGDGVGDILIGARYADPHGSKSGASYVIFGRCDGFAPVIELSALAGGTGSTGFVLAGVSAGDHSGWSVSDAGDVNGDGIGDLIIGAWYADPNGSNSGASYVVFGRSAGFGPVFELSSLAAGNGDGGFVVEGVAAHDHSGRTVSAAGDVNGDGIDDLLVGAYAADPHGNRSGASYVVFGRTGGFGPIFELSSLADGGGSEGFVLNGVSAEDQAGFSLSAAGDVNGDGVGDLIISARYADPNGSNSGASYVLFGIAPSPTVTALTTGDSTPTLSGTATVGKGGTLTVTVGGETYTAGDGHLSRSGKSWSLTIPVGDALADGTYDVTATVTGPAGKVISDPTSDELVVDLTAPAAPTVTAQTTPDTTPTITGTATVGDGETLTVTVNGVTYTAGDGDLVLAGGNWSLVIPAGDALSAGTYAVTATVTDAVANAASDPTTDELVVDLTAPNVPTVTARSTSDSTPTITGTAVVADGETLTVTVDGVTYSVGDGHLTLVDDLWSLTIPDGDALPPGTYAVTATITDGASNATSDTTTDELVITPPPPPDPSSPPPPPGPANHAPVAGDDAYTIDRNKMLTVTAAGLLANDSDADGDRLVVAAVLGEPAHGTLWWGPDGGFAYLPQPGFSGTDSFEYRIADGEGGTDTATVAIMVLPARIPPPRSISGGFGDETLSGTGAPDTIFGMDGSDTIEGEGGRDLLDGGAGNDLILAGTDEDVVWGGQGSDMLLGGEGADWILGERGPDRIHGGKAADHIWGGRGDDRLLGDAGPDMLSGDLGNDTLTGGEGADRFAVREDGGLDLVTDYDLQGGDVIALEIGPDGRFGAIVIAGFADILPRLSDGPDGAFLDLGDGNGIILAGISRHQLSADDFILV